MQGTVIIVGAGATLAQASGLRPKQTLFHPPLDANFFGSAEKLAGAGRANIREAAESLKTELSTRKLFASPFGSVISLEQFFADVYYDVASGSSAEAFSAFTSLLRLYNNVLAETTNWLSEHARAGPLDRLLRHEMEKADGERVTIITFNHDLVIESCVNRLPRTRNQWCLSCLYGAQAMRPLIGEEVSFPSLDAACPHPLPLRLLKLHGSLNWGLRSRDRDPKKGTLFPSKDQQIFYHDQRVVRDAATIAFEAKKRGRRRWYFWPLVVPPIYEKGRITGSGILAKLWREAGEALSNAKKLVMVGYSLPHADVLAAQMLRRAYRDNVALKGLHCINPDPAIVGRLQARLDSDVIHLYRNITDYLEFEVAR